MQPTILLSPAVQLALVAAGLFFLAALLTGVWKYAAIARSPQATAPVYVDIAHRAALMYAFAAILLAQFAGLSAWSDALNLGAVAVQVGFFGAAIGGYVLHGLLRDTDNQFLRPQRIGRLALPRHGLLLFMLLLIAAEVGGFLVLFAGLLRALAIV